MTQNDARTVVISSPHVPIELVYAARMRPHLVRSGSTPTPLADARLEPGVFPNRIRQLVELALAGHLREAAAIVLPRTSEADYKGFLYLREFARQGTVRLPECILLMDLLQSNGGHVAVHNAAAAEALFAALVVPDTGLSRSERRDEELHTAIVRVNTARAALRRLLALRRGWPRITGAEALALIGAFWDQAPETYTAMVTAAADDIAARSPLVRPRVLLLGSPIDGPHLHAVIEAHGAVVVAETALWGTTAAATDVDPLADPFAAIVDKYRREIWGARTPIDQVRRWIRRELDAVDAVVVSLPTDDGVFGWDYPWLRNQLQTLDMPHVLLTCDPHAPIADEDHERLAALVGEAMPRQEFDRG